MSSNFDQFQTLYVIKKYYLFTEFEIRIHVCIFTRGRNADIEYPLEHLQSNIPRQPFVVQHNVKLLS